jgi:AcrR family transcriptional regulator
MALTRADWTEAALEALVRDGIAAVAVEPLARRLAATKGSFYWHFTGRDELFDATLELWERRETTEVIERIQAIPTPRDRLIELGAATYAGAARGNGHAAVLAAVSDRRVRSVLERVTRTRLAFIERLYCELGVAVSDAARHARVAYALCLGIGELRRADPKGDPARGELDKYLKLAVDAMMPPALRTTSAPSRPSSPPRQTGSRR